MTRGRKPKPTALKILAGNPGKRPLNRQEPAFAAAPAVNTEAGAPPKDLPKLGKVFWNQFYPRLLQYGVLQETDLPAFEALCRAWALFKAADNKCNQKNGMIQTSASGYQSPSGWIALRGRFYTEFKQLAEQFGLTPSARARIKIVPPAGRAAGQPGLFPDDQGAPSPADELAAFLQGSDVIGRIGA